VAKIQSRTCITCNIGFSYTAPTGGRRFHCSPECRAKHKEQRAQERKQAKRGRVRTRTCPVCNLEFSYEIAQGRDRKFCSKTCYTANTVRLQRERPRHYPPCSTPKCVGLATRVGLGLCEACYGRLRRTGSVARKGAKLRRKNKEGYIVIIAEHPLISSNGRLYEHRKVVFDRIGVGPHPCFWCAQQLQDWDEIVIDHLNEIKDDNRFENLVVSCNPCNRARGALLPFIRRMRDEALPVFIECVKEQRQVFHV